MNQPIIDVDIFGGEEDKSVIELRANEAAADLLVPKHEITGFITRVNPMFSEDQIVGFAKRIHVHPGIIIGQLQKKGLIHWSFYRKRLEKIRVFVTSSAITDGYGQIINDLGRD
jgi:HTH-type transcriptional regulator/antitoxin HigA